MSIPRHLLALAYAPALTLSLSCASRPELARARPALSVQPRWSVESELRATPPRPSAPNPYAPTRSLDATQYSWQSEKRAECPPGAAAAKLEPDTARTLLGAFPERIPDPAGAAQPVKPDLVIAGLRPAIHHCLSRWSDAKLDAQGSVRFALELGCAGEVQAISAENQGVDESALSCLFSVVAPAHFAPPAGGHATVLLPVVFKKAAR